jgi:hypothetical protein
VSERELALSSDAGLFKHDFFWTLSAAGFGGCATLALPAEQETE